MDKHKESFCEDICNIARVLPNLAGSVIYEELNNVIDQSDRVQIVLKKYFASYEEHNCLTDDIKKIKRVVPNYPFVQINNDLIAVEAKENRVQLVLKKHFDGQSKAAKRALLLGEIDLTEDSPSKKFKSNNDVIEEIIIPEEKEQSSNETESYSIEIPSTEDQLTIEETNNAQEEKKAETDINQQLVNSPCVIVVDDKSSNESEKCQNSDQNNTQTSTETENILSVLSNIFPQYSSEILSTVCQDLDIDIYGSPNENTLELVVSVLFDQDKNKKIFKRSKSEICDEQSVITCSVESSENSSNSATQEYSDDKNHNVECNIEDFDRNCGLSKGFSVCDDLDSFREEDRLAVNIKNSDKSNNTAQTTSSINNAPANIPSENIIEEVVSDINFDPNFIEKTLCKSKINERVDNIIAELSSTNIISTRPAEQIASTSNYYNNLEYDTAINNLIQEFKDSVPGSIAAVLNTNPNLEPTPSTSKFYDNPEPSTSNIDFYSGLSSLSLSIPSTSTNIPSTSTNIPESSISKFSTAESSISSSSENDVFNNKLENELRNSNHILESNQNSVTNTNSNILDFETAFFNNINLNNTDNMPTSTGGRVTSSVQKTPVLIQSSSIIRPAILRTNSSSTVTPRKIAIIRSKSVIGTSKTSIIKTASFKPKILSPDQKIVVHNAEDYKKRDRPESPEAHLVFEEQHKILQDLFPDADPTYLQHHCERLIDQPDAFEQFVTSLVESKTYPTKAEYLKKMKLSAQEVQYTTEFDVKKFLEVIPNPAEFFNDPKRQISYSNFDDTTYAVTFLKNTFCTAAIKDITHIFRKTSFSVLRSANALESFQNLKSKRKPYPVTSCKNIPLLQEIAYVKHKKEIELYLAEQKLEKLLLRKQAKESGLMKTCQCCYDDEVMPDDIASCESGAHIFCKECIRRGCEVVIGDGKLDFPCLETCNSKFSLQVLQAVLTPKVFSKMAQRKQMEEVKSAGIEDLEFCPFCDFATIPAPTDKLFRCLNDDCMKESCRLCKEPSHIPLRCDEVEKDKDVKMRTYIENKMTEALLRKCYKCGLKFIKESGCNKMTCSCGAMMCYVCNQPVQDYKHFNGQGGDQTHLCPLYSDTHKLHMDAIKKSAESAKKEMGVDKGNALKIDPTVDIDHHYRRLASRNPAIPNIQVVFPPNINNIIP